MMTLLLGVAQFAFAEEEYCRLGLDDEARPTTYYEKFFNEAFDWNINELSDADAVSEPLEEISMKEMRAAICQMKKNKSTGPTGVAAEMLKSSRESRVR